MLCFLVSTLFVFLLSLMLGLTSLRCWDLYIARAGPRSALVLCIAPSVPQPVFTITEKAPTRAFSWLKVPTSAFTFKTLLRH